MLSCFVWLRFVFVVLHCAALLCNVVFGFALLSCSLFFDVVVPLALLLIVFMCFALPYIALHISGCVPEVCIWDVFGIHSSEPVGISTTFPSTYTPSFLSAV